MAKDKVKKPFGHDRFVVTKARYLRMLAPFVSDNELRYYLNGIHFEANCEGIIAVATDGHRMGVIRDVSGSVRGSWICPVSKGLLSAIQNAQRDDQNVAAVFVADTAYLVPSKLIKRVQGAKSADSFSIYREELPPIDGTYPLWPRVFPKKTVARLRPMTVDAAYMADLNKVAQAAGLGVKTGAKGHAWLIYQPGGNSDPFLARNPRIPEFVGVHMPMRGDDIEPVPEWIPAAA